MLQLLPGPALVHEGLIRGSVDRPVRSGAPPARLNRLSPHRSRLRTAGSQDSLASTGSNQDLMQELQRERETVVELVEDVMRRSSPEAAAARRWDGVADERQVAHALQLCCWINGVERRRFSPPYAEKDADAKHAFFLEHVAEALTPAGIQRLRMKALCVSVWWWALRCVAASSSQMSEI